MSLMPSEEWSLCLLQIFKWFLVNISINTVKEDSSWSGIRNVAESLHGSKHMTWLGAMREWRKDRHLNTEKLGLGGLGTLMEKPQHLEISVCLLFRVKHRGRVILCRHKKHRHITCRQTRRQGLFYTAGFRRQALLTSVRALCRGVVFKL